MKRRVLLVVLPVVALALLVGTVPAAAAPRGQGTVVTSTADTGAGTLREALEQASAGITITFDPMVFPPDDPATIALVSPLPQLAQGQMTIDASKVGVILEGSQLPDEEVVHGLVITSSDNVVRGLQVLHFPGIGIVIENGAQHNTVGGDRTIGSGPTGQGNVISANRIEGVRIAGVGTDHNLVIGNNLGTDAAGTSPLGNGFHGIAIIQGAQNNHIGGTTPGERNIISGNAWDGVFIHDSGTMHNTVSGNYIGTNITGSAAIPNENFGINLGNATQNNIVGGDNITECNVISGNRSGGVNVAGDGVRDNTISGNYIGVDIGGNQPLPNFHGVVLGDGTSYNTVQGNVISGNGGGLIVSGSGTSRNTIIGNYIGTNAAGDATIGNQVDGVWVGDSAEYNVVGGSTADERNVVSGNWNNGAVIDGSDHNIMSGNYIGTDATGTVALGNGNIGVVLAWGAQYNVIGGSTPGERNLISGNHNVGVSIANPGTANNALTGNYIGTDLSGALPMGNAGHGVRIADGAEANTIGPGNVIAHNGGSAVTVSGPETIGNTLTANSIYGNGGLGIEHSEGANAGLSAPTIARAGTRSVQGAAPPNSTVEVFCDEKDEGRAFQGSTTADESGGFVLVVPVGTLSGPNVTATATDEDGSTSQFSSPTAPQEPVLTRELPHIVGPRQVSVEPTVLGTNLGLALFGVLFFGLSSNVFNTILKDYRDESAQALGRLIPGVLADLLRRMGSVLAPSSKQNRARLLVTWLIVLLFTSLVESFLDPRVGLFSFQRLGLLATLFVSAVAVSGLELGSDLYARRRWAPSVEAESKVQWVGVAIAAACVGLSRALDFKPGYLYGVLGAIYLVPKIAGVSRTAKRATLVLSTTLLGGFALWVASAFLPQALAELEPIFLTVFLLSLQGVFFALIPLTFTEGGDIWSWRRGGWLVFFAVVFFCFYHFLLNPGASDVQALRQNGVQSLLTLVIVFGLLTLILWFLLPFRLGRRRANSG
jgi:parallel beta-helix repeat protein